jgi:hypothetical protein
MKKLLILAYDFPPYVSVGGLRPYSWYKYLKEFGIYPVVVTRQWGNKYGNHLDYVAAGESDTTIVEETEMGTIIHTPYKPNLSNRLLMKYGETRFRFLRKAISAFYEFAQWILPVGSKYGLYNAAKQYLKNNRVDCIIATGEPFVLFRYASNLSEKHNVPWIADYRDPWIQTKSRVRNKFFMILYQQLEKKYTQNAQIITTVSDYFVSTISETIPNQQYTILPNGYDNELTFSLPNHEKNDGHLTIALAGTIYPYHPVERFFETINSIVSKDSIKLRIRFYGINNEDELRELTQNTFISLSEIIEFYPRMDNTRLLENLRQADIFLLFNYYSVLGTKIYDYLALKRPILLCFANDSSANELKKKHYNLKEFPHLSNSLQADMITATNSGIIVRDAEHLKVVLQELWDEFQSRGYIECNSHGIEQYSRRRQTEKLAEVIKEVIEEYSQRHIQKT